MTEVDESSPGEFRSPEEQAATETTTEEAGDTDPVLATSDSKELLRNSEELEAHLKEFAEDFREALEHQHKYDADRRDCVFRGNFPSDITEKYVLTEDVLGEGSFGTVRECVHKETKQVFALKTIDKGKLPDATQLRREINILMDVDHPHIIKLYDVYEDSTTIYLVSELCSGGELYDRVVEKTKSKLGHFSEYTAARIIRNILSAISYCHDVKKIVHRDLKPENFLLTDKTDNAQVKIIDFGLSRYSAEVMKSQVGTIYYVAPEVLFGEYTVKADIWSIGVVTYVLLCGFAPFNAGCESLTYNVVKEGHVNFPSPAWDKISPEAIHFIKRLLDRDPEERPSAAEALQDPWVNQKHVNPFAKIWHGTFLNNQSDEAKAEAGSRQIAHDDREKQSDFESALKNKKKDKKKFAESLKSYFHRHSGIEMKSITKRFSA